MGGYYWFDRQTWQSNQRELESQISTLNSRIENLDARRGASAETFGQQLINLEAALQHEENRLGALEATLHELEESSVDREVFDSLQRSFQSVEQQVEGLATIIDTMQRSLSSLEKVGDEARAALNERAEALEGRLSDNDQRYQSLADADRELSSRLEAVVNDIEALQNDNTQQQRWEQLSSEVSSNRASLTELRQTQLAIEAVLENLDTRLQ